ncbi:hypothetical protein EV360DRAFT_71171 [Lentinula raphanica]|nr:hypothetical protein EV360DRAFT_71171 [Lentinula raphanica]
MFHSMLPRNLPPAMCLLLVMAYLSVTLVIAIPLPATHDVPQSALPASDNRLRIGHFNWVKNGWTLLTTKTKSDASLAVCLPGFSCLGYCHAEICKIDKEPTLYKHVMPMKVSVVVPLDKNYLDKTLSSVQALRSALVAKKIQIEISDERSMITAILLLLQKRGEVQYYNEVQTLEQNTYLGKGRNGDLWMYIQVGYRNPENNQWSGYRDRDGKVRSDWEPNAICFPLWKPVFCVGLVQSGDGTWEVLDIQPKTHKLPSLNLRLIPNKFGSPETLKVLRGKEDDEIKFEKEFKLIKEVKAKIRGDLKDMEWLQTYTEITINDPQAYVRAVLTYLQKEGWISISESDLRKNLDRPLRYLLDNPRQKTPKSTTIPAVTAGAKRPYESDDAGSSLPNPKRLGGPAISEVENSRTESPSSGPHGESSNSGAFATETEGQPLTISGQEHSTTVPPNSHSGPDTLDPDGKAHAQSRTGKPWDFNDILS